MRYTFRAIFRLTAGGFYTSNTVFHRVIAGFMIQGGDPQTNGIGGPVFRYDDEFHPRAIFSGSGQLALAHPGYPNDKDNNGSQFFVTVAPYRFGDFSYTIFGQLVRGFSVLSCINNTATNASSRPLADVIITRVSLVPDNFDTVLTLLGTNIVGVVGTIEVIADDGAGGRSTNSFQATTVTDAVNDPPLLNVNAVSNLSAVVNCKLTNSLSGWDLEGNVMYYGLLADQKAKTNAMIESFNSTNGEVVIVPSNGYTGPLRYLCLVSPNAGLYPYDSQIYTFAIGDTPIIGHATNFTAFALTSFTNQLLATFTNGVASSSGTNFTAFINWGDNSTNSGIILTNAAGWKEVHGSHTYTNAGSYPVDITVQSYLGATANLISTATVPPSVSVMRTGTSNIVVWPAWAVDYRLQSTTNLASANWQPVGGFSALIGYDNTVSNSMTDNAMFFRLKR
ncbi:MAG: peptidylprolyl isomerase [bacterium]